MKSIGRRNPAIIELVLVVFFLALTASLLAQVFAKAHIMSEDSRAQTAGMIAAQDIIEHWKADPLAGDELFPAVDGWLRDEESSVFTALRDKNMLLPEGDGSDYILRAELSGQDTDAGALCRLRITVVSARTEGAEPLVDCAATVYLPEGRS